MMLSNCPRLKVAALAVTSLRKGVTQNGGQAQCTVYGRGSVGFIALTLLKVESFTTSGIIFLRLKNKKHISE